MCFFLHRDATNFCIKFVEARVFEFADSFADLALESVQLAFEYRAECSLPSVINSVLSLQNGKYLLTLGRWSLNNDVPWRRDFFHGGFNVGAEKIDLFIRSNLMITINFCSTTPISK